MWVQTFLNDAICIPKAKLFMNVLIRQQFLSENKALLPMVDKNIEVY